MNRSRTVVLMCLGVVCAGLLPGCVRRTILVTSEPSGALVYLNDREVGRTPVEAEFVFYGDYDVRLVREGYEPLATAGVARPPLWDNIPFDLVAEAVPGEPHVQIHWHYDLEPLGAEPVGVVDRARELRERLGGPEGTAAPPAGAAEGAIEGE